MIDDLQHISFRRAKSIDAIGRTFVLLPKDLGILSEMIDVKSGDFLGNLPQGLSHLALIQAVISMSTGPESANPV